MSMQMENAASLWFLPFLLPSPANLALPATPLPHLAHPPAHLPAHHPAQALQPAYLAVLIHMTMDLAFVSAKLDSSSSMVLAVKVLLVLPMLTRTPMAHALAILDSLIILEFALDALRVLFGAHLSASASMFVDKTLPTVLQPMHAFVTPVMVSLADLARLALQDTSFLTDTV